MPFLHRLAPSIACIAPAAARRTRLRAGLALCACATLLACASTPEPSGQPAAACPNVRQLHAAQLYGSWELELTALGLRGQLTLRQHPEFSDSLRGEFRYGGHRSIASGDVEDGEFNLDESRDGKRFFAFWSGQLVPQACGAEIRGAWQTVPTDGQPAQESPFVLRRSGINNTP